jgi:outer membrane scaffolding protein for murein synthesis (MipA/OmpV family)
MKARRFVVPVLIVSAAATQASAAGFDTYGAAPEDLVAPVPTTIVIVEAGLGVSVAPAYEGSSEYTTTFAPIVEVERLFIPGLIDISKPTGAFSIAPAMDFISERKAAEHETLEGLNDVDATYIPGVRVGYQLALSSSLAAEVYGKVQYAFGGAEDFLGTAGATLSWRLTPALVLSGGPELSFAGEDYMDTYFGVSDVESVATGGRLAAYDPEAGLKTAGISFSAKYEFVADTFVTLSGTYRQLVGSAADSPIVDEESQFLVSVGLSRRFAFGS